MENCGFSEDFLDLTARGANDYCVMEVQKFGLLLMRFECSPLIGRGAENFMISKMEFHQFL